MTARASAINRPKGAKASQGHWAEGLAETILGGSEDQRYLEMQHGSYARCADGPDDAAACPGESANARQRCDYPQPALRKRRRGRLGGCTAAAASGDQADSWFVPMDRPKSLWFLTCDAEELAHEQRNQLGSFGLPFANSKLGLRRSRRRRGQR